MSIKGILFDKDGTIIDFFEVWGDSSVPAMKSVMEKYGVDDSSLSEILKRIGVVDGVIDPEGALSWKPFDLIAEDLCDIFLGSISEESKASLKNDIIEAYHKEIFSKYENKKYPTFTDMEKLFKGLYERGIHIGVATTSELDETVMCMENLGIKEYVSFYATAGTELPSKPDGVLIKMAAEKWGIKPEEIAMVGDTPNDVRFAENGGAISVAVLSGTGKKEDFIGKANYILSSVADIFEILD